ncbi:hypothetical protein BgiBS90_004343, partial [Biomphalaria glabrata]
NGQSEAVDENAEFIENTPQESTKVTESGDMKESLYKLEERAITSEGDTKIDE